MLEQFFNFRDKRDKSLECKFNIVPQREKNINEFIIYLSFHDRGFCDSRPL